MIRFISLVCLGFIYAARADCPDGYTSHVDNCYALLPVRVTWGEAGVTTNSCIGAKLFSGECPHGYEINGDWCYALLHVRTTWAEGEHYCEAVGGDLAVINDATEEQFVEGMLTRLHDTIKTTQVWIGGTDLLQEGVFVAPKTLEPLTYFNWGGGEPDNLGGQHCLAIFRDGGLKWDDNNCEVLNFPLCKRSREGAGQQGIIG